jgi:hypothetical protein
MAGHLETLFAAAAQVKDDRPEFSAVLLLHIYCIYDSDMTHGGLRYSKGFIGVKSQCYFGHNYHFFCCRVHAMGEEVCLGVHSTTLLRASPKLLYQHARAKGVGRDNMSDTVLSSGLDMNHAAGSLSLVALYNVVFERKVLGAVSSMVTAG